MFNPNRNEVMILEFLADLNFSRPARYPLATWRAGSKSYSETLITPFLALRHLARKWPRLPQPKHVTPTAGHLFNP